MKKIPCAGAFATQLEPTMHKQPSRPLTGVLPSLDSGSCQAVYKANALLLSLCHYAP